MKDDESIVTVSTPSIAHLIVSHLFGHSLILQPQTIGTVTLPELNQQQ
jgi:hypothetical protein